MPNTECTGAALYDRSGGDETSVITSYVLKNRDTLKESTLAVFSIIKHV